MKYLILLIAVVFMNCASKKPNVYSNVRKEVKVKMTSEELENVQLMSEFSKIRDKWRIKENAGY